MTRDVPCNPGARGGLLLGERRGTSDRGSPGTVPTPSGAALPMSRKSASKLLGPIQRGEDAPKSPLTNRLPRAPLPRRSEGAIEPHREGDLREERAPNSPGEGEPKTPGDSPSPAFGLGGGSSPGGALMIVMNSTKRVLMDLL